VAVLCRFIGATINSIDYIAYVTRQTQIVLGSAVFLVFAAAVLVPALGRAKAAGERRRCVDNLKQLALACSISENAGSTPMTILQLSNSVRDPKLFICPSDKSRQNVNTWDALLAKGGSYSYDPGMLADKTVSHILLRCTIHGNVALADGSVHMLPSFGK